MRTWLCKRSPESSSSVAPWIVRPCDQKRTYDGGQHSNRLASDRWKSTSQERSVLRDGPYTGSTAADLLAPIRENRRVYLGGLIKPLNNHASDLGIRSLFGGFEVEAVSKVKWPERDKMCDGSWYAFVDFRSAEDAQRAVA
jgi:hypothetical protein